MPVQSNTIYDPLLQRALRLLAKHRYTVLKLKEKLLSFYNKQIEAGEFDPLPEPERDKIIRQVLDRLKELKYLDDTQFSKDYVENREEFRPRGKFLLKRELKRKGIHPDLAERVVEEAELDEEQLAIKALKKKIRQLEKYPPNKQREKSLRFLAGRGFSIPAIYKAIEHWYNKSEIQ